MRKVYSYFVLLIFLSSCGGGGGGSSDSPIGGGSSTPTISVTISSSAQSAEVNSSVTITWSSTSATSCSASGVWSGTKSTSGSESVIIGLGGSNNFSLTCSAPGANSGSNSVSVNGIRYIAGTVFDGYIRGASIFIDENNNLTADENETVITSDNNGNFSDLLYTNGSLVSVGGFDLDTGADLSNLTLVNELTGFEATKLISPFTTLIAYLQDSSNLNEILGIDASIDLMNVDPIPLLGEGIYDYMYEKGNQLTVLSYSLQNFFDDENSQVYFQAIANELEEQFNSNQVSIDIESSSFINEVIDEAEELKSETIAQETEANLRTVISAVLPTLRVHAESNTTTAVQRFAFNTLQDDLKDSSTLTNSASTTLQKYQNEIYAYIASVESIEESLISPDFNASPVITSPTSFSVNENQLSIGTISATDLDGDSLLFSVSGPEISISGSGVMTFVSAPDYETKSSYTVTVTVSDGVASVSQTINITILDVDESAPNQAPTISSSASFSADENQTSIGSIVASDADGDPLNFSISGSEINISGTGVLTFATPPDYETKNSYSATVTVSDGSDSVSQIISISINDINEIGNAPVFSSAQIFNSDENQTSIGNIIVSDADGDTLTYSISGSEINISSTGVLSFASSPDYESKNSYTATVTVSDGNNETSQNITINITDITEVLAVDDTSSGIEDDNIRVNVLTNDTFNSSDVTLTATNGSNMTVEVQNDQISVAEYGHPTIIYFPDANWHGTDNFSYTVTSGGESDQGVVTVTVTPVNDAPTISSLSSAILVDENFSTVTTVLSNDLESDTINYSLTGSDASSLSINSSGLITFNSPPDYESKSSYSITVNVSDGSLSSSQALTININDITETGTAGNDTINGGQGDDTILGLAGDDAIDGGSGNDVLRGGLDVDVINGGDGDDTISADECYYGFSIPFDDISSVCSVATFGGQNIDGGDGNDIIYAPVSNATVSGGSGNDTIYAVDGFGGSVTEQGVPLNGKIEAGSGNDVIRQFGGDSFVYGDDGNDTFYPSSGMDRFVGGSGVDKIAFASGEGSTNWDNVNMFLDFVDGEDKIVLLNGLTFSDLDLYTTFPGEAGGEANYDSLNGSTGPCNNKVYVTEVNDGRKGLLVICSATSPTIDSSDFETN